MSENETVPESTESVPPAPASAPEDTVDEVTPAEETPESDLTDPQEAPADSQEGPAVETSTSEEPAEGDEAIDTKLYTALI